MDTEYGAGDVVEESASKEEKETTTYTISITFKDAWRQIIASVIAHTIVIHAGINLSFSAIMLPQLDENSTLLTTKSEQSWIASLVTISLPVGSLVLGILADRLGRKKMLQIVSIIFALAWLIQGMAKTVWHIYLARILLGFCGGLTTISLIYVSEITHPNYRSMLLSLNSVSVSFGILLTCVLGTWLQWYVMAYIYAAIVIVTMFFICCLPESPHWLMTFKGDAHKAAASLRRLYKNNLIFEHEYQQILRGRVSRAADNNGATVDERSRLLRFKQNLVMYKEPIIYKPVRILVVIFIFQQFSGAYVIIFYAVNLFREVGGDLKNGINEYVALVLLGVIRFVMSVISALLSKRVGRRPLLLISGSGMMMTSLVAGCYMYAKANYTDNFPMICLLLYVCFGSLGYLIIPWTLIGELLPVKVRAKLGGALISIAYILMFVVVKVFPSVLESLGMPCLFVGFAVINLSSVCFIYLYLPETLGKSFNEIEDYFRR